MSQSFTSCGIRAEGGQFSSQVDQTMIHEQRVVGLCI